MKTMTLATQIEKDGKIRLEIPCDLPPGPVEIVLVIQPKTTSGAPPYDTLKGFLAGKFPTDFDVDADLQEMNRQWEERMELPE